MKKFCKKFSQRKYMRMTERFQQILRPQRTGCFQGGSPGSGSLGALPSEAGVTPGRARLLVRQIRTRSRPQRNGACVPCLHSDFMGSDVGASVHPSAVLSHVRATHGTMQQDIEPCCIVAVCERQSPKGLIAAPWIRASVAESGVTPVTTRSAPDHPTLPTRSFGPALLLRSLQKLLGP